MKYPNPQYKPRGGRGRTNETRAEIAQILSITPRWARTLMNRGMTIEKAREQAKSERIAQGFTE